MIELPRPGSTPARTVLAAPAVGPGNWAGAPSAVRDQDGEIVLALRIRDSHRRGGTMMLACWSDRSGLEPIATWDRSDFNAESLERPAVVGTAEGWQLYVSCATPGTKHWRIDVLDASTLAGLARAEPRTAFAGSAELGVKDPVLVRRDGLLHAWICCHPLDIPGAEDRMYTQLATSSDDGLSWTWREKVLTGRPGAWDARGARVTAVFPDGRAFYDGRRSAGENFSERTGIAGPGDGFELIPDGTAPIADVRYVTAVAEDMGYRLFYEAPLSDGSHELRTELVGPLSPPRR